MGDYSVETKNRFQLILDDDDVDIHDILKQEESKSEKKKTEIGSTKTVKNTKVDKKDKLKKSGQKVDNVNVANIQNTGIKTSGKGNGEMCFGTVGKECNVLLLLYPWPILFYWTGVYCIAEFFG